MEIRVHREFVRAVERLSSEEQKAVRRTLLMIQQDQPTTGMRFHKIGEFLSISPTMDLRMIATGTPYDPTFLYVDHHDAAYKWAERRRAFPASSGFEILPLLPEIETVPSNTDAPLVLERLAAAYGTREGILDYISGLSPEWQEWFWRAYVENEKPTPAAPQSCSFTYCFNADDDVAASLQLSAEEWTLFLHPKQREIVDDSRSRSLVVTGGPGTGKTVVLLCRLLKPSAEPQKAKVLLTYSQRLVKLYRETLKIGRLEPPAHAYIQNVNDLLGQFRSETYGFELELENNRLFRVNRRRPERVEIEELMIDEFQDCDPDTILFVQKLIECGLRVTIGVDVGQSVFRANSSLVNSVIQRADKTVLLTYCYRSSIQIVQSARNIKETACSAFPTLERNHDANAYALSGAPVFVIEADDMKDQIRICDKIFAELEKRFDCSELALIYLQYPNPAFKGPSREEAALKNHPRLGPHYWFAPLTKGREFWAGVVFVSRTFLKKDMGPSASALRVNMLYVAMTRFRDELSVVYPRECPLAPALRNFAHIKI